MKRPRLKSADRQNQLLELTFELLADTPVHALSTRKLAKAAGISQPAVFRHFRSREALLLAALAQAQAELLADVRPLIERPAPSPSLLEQIATRVISQLERRPGLPRLVFADAAGTDGLHAAVLAMMRAQKALFASVVSGPEASQIAATLSALLQGITLQWLLEGRTERLEALAGPPVAKLLADLPPPGSPVVPANPDSRAGQPGLHLLDVRPALARGHEPLPEIIAAIDPLAAGATLLIITPMRPKPLLALLGRNGHHVSAHPLGETGDHVVFVGINGGRPPTDLRDGEPPEPLEITLRAEATLSPGESFTAWLPRFPSLLAQRLDERPSCAAFEGLDDGTCVVHLWRRP